MDPLMKRESGKKRPSISKVVRPLPKGEHLLRKAAFRDLNCSLFNTKRKK